jgi:hypothetical protein
MCGACGSVSYTDAVLGQEPSIRKRLLVAQIVTTACSGLPGAPRSRALAEGWSVSGTTGSITLCHTVEEIWLAVLDRGGLRLQQELAAWALPEAPNSLEARVISLGHRLSQER